MRYLACLFLLFLVACGSGEGGGDDDGQVWPEQYMFGGDRPVYLEVPATYDHAVGAPLVILLHGYGANGVVQTAYTGLGNLVDDAGVLFAAPDGTEDAGGKLFWNAGPACCNFGDIEVDDVAYIGGLIEEIAGVWNVDADRVYLVGHSNGGFMSYRMACERADLIAGIVNLAGAAVAETQPCTPSEPVSILHIHGDNDETIPYEGLASCQPAGCEYPGAVASVELWADRDGCTGAFSSDEPIDLERRLDGAETTVERIGGCPSGIDTELWSIVGGGHLPSLSDSFATQVWDWLAAHPKP